jgi:hypothetical protein
MTGARTGVTQILSGAAIVAVILAAPLAWRGVLAAWGPADADGPPSYLPAVEARRDRIPFNPLPGEELRTLNPGTVIIGDSMAGRVDPFRLGELLGNEPVGTLVEPATGSGWWYLAFKNYVVETKIKPKWVLIFFRDTNLTDPMFRLLEPYRSKLDMVARDLEPELNAVVATRMNGPWYRVHTAINRMYGVDRARNWLEPLLPGWTARVVTGKRKRQKLLDEVNASFGLTQLRPFAQADMAAADESDTDFAANLPASMLPEMVRLGRENNLRLCFIRILRRTVDGHFTKESPRLRQYVRDLRAWFDAQNVLFIDDRDNPEMAKLHYADGDHLAGDAMTAYAELLGAALSKIKK